MTLPKTLLVVCLVWFAVASGLQQVGNRFPEGVQVGGAEGTECNSTHSGHLRFSLDADKVQYCSERHGTWRSLTSTNASAVDVDDVLSELAAIREMLQPRALQASLHCTGNGDWDANTQLCSCYADNTRGHYVGVGCAECSEGWSEDSERRCVVDIENPVLTLNGDSVMTVEAGAVFSDPGAQAVDNGAGDLSSEIVVVSDMRDNENVVGIYTIVYSISDDFGNSAQVSRTVHRVDTTPPTVMLIGAAAITVEGGSVYDDAGVHITDNANSTVFTTVANSDVDTSAVGTYSVTYTVTDESGNQATSATRTVVVVDTTAPVLTLNGDAVVTIEAGVMYTDPGASVSDNIDVVSSPVTFATVPLYDVGILTREYNYTDTSGNVGASVFRTINVVDTTSPSLTLLADPVSGNVDMIIEQFSVFQDPGVRASDNTNKSIPVVITGADFDTSVLGTYFVAYDATDPSGNVAVRRTRQVVVADRDECAVPLSFCDETEICANTVGSYSCTCKPTLERDIGTGLCSTSLESCLAVHHAGNSQSGVYWINPDGDHATLPIEMYCDMTTDGGGWALVTAMDSPQGSTEATWRANGKYENYFYLDSWTRGASDGIPTAVDHSDSTGLEVFSQDWRNVLKVGQLYELRQHFWRHTPGSSSRGYEFDVSYIFNYTGYVTQNDAPDDPDLRAWKLKERVVITDSSAITWHLPEGENALFWPPYYQGFSGNVYSGCGSHAYEETGCSAGTLSTTAMRYGNAGIIGDDSDSQDPAAAFAPHMNKGNANYDLVFTHQGTVHRTSGTAQALRYYLREVYNSADGYASTIRAEVPRSSCWNIRARIGNSNQPSSASLQYSLDRAGESDVVYCDMNTDGGGWQLMTEFSVNASPRNYDAGNKYAMYMRDASWIEGYAEAKPLSAVPSYDSFHVLSHNWSDYMETSTSYDLRQEFYFSSSPTYKLDVAYAFTFNGNVLQNKAPDSLSARVWELTNRRVYSDESGISWHVTSPTYFWLPFSTSPSSGGTNLVTACGSYDYESGGCGASNAAARRYGNAGIIGNQKDSNDPAGSWAPHTNGEHDLVYVHQMSSRWGASGRAHALRYWIREV